MQMKAAMSCRDALLPLMLLAAGVACAAPGTKYAPPWEQSPASSFSVANRTALADRVPMPLMMDFTWSAPESDDMVKYQGQFLGNCHYRNIPLSYDGNWNWDRVDKFYEWAAKHRVYIVLGLNMQQGVPYTRTDPTCAARLSDGSIASSNKVSFMHPGYRQVLAKALTELAEHVKNKPYHLGYYPQDEFAYRELSGYEDASVAAFKDWLMKRYGNLAKLNETWGSRWATVEAITPPPDKEPTRAWADWQEFRRFAQMDFARHVYGTLKQADPNHLVIWSLPFMGWYGDCASWWQFAPVSDVLMRHGIGYSTGVYRLKMLNALSQWCGKPANALCMPPEYNTSFTQMSFMMDGPQSGLSHVCTAGTIDNGPYMGSADPDNSWKRREPLYTRSRALNGLVRQMGPTYLESAPRSTQVGVYVSDRQVLVEGFNINALNGMLLMLADLNLESEIFSEYSWDRLKQYPAVVLGSFSRCATAKQLEELRAYVNGGGTLIVTAGALAADEFGLPPATTLDDILGAPVGDAVEVKEISLKSDRLTTGLNSLPVLGKVQPRQPAAGATVLGELPDGAAVTLRNVGKGQVLYFGMDPGLPYQAGYTDDFAGVAAKPDKDLLDTQAGFHFEPTRGAEQALGLQAHKAYAMLVSRVLADRKITPRVTVGNYADAAGALKALSFRRGDDYWIGLANRIVLPGKHHQRDAVSEFHQLLTGLPVSCRLDPGSRAAFAVNMPIGNRTGQGFSAMPELLPLKGADFTLPRLEDCAAVLLTNDHEPVLGIAVDRSQVVRGQSVTLDVRAVNPSPKRVSLQLEVDGTPALKGGQTLSFSIAPGSLAQGSVRVPVAADAAPGYETLQVVGKVDGRQILSPSAEIEILPDIQLQVTGADRTLFPVEENGARIKVIATNNRPEAGALTAAITLPAGYQARPATLQVSLPPQQVVTTEVMITAAGDAAPVSEGEVTVTSQSGESKSEFRRKLRLARGVVTYVDNRPYRLGAALETRAPRDLLCLENQYLRAEYIPSSGTLHSLIPRHAGRDYLIEGDYPIGLVWYGLGGGWQQSDLSSDGETARMVLKGGPQSKVTLTATLGKNDRHLRIEYDCSDLGPVKNIFYLMNHVTPQGKPDAIVVPVKGQPLRLQRGRRDITVANIAAPWAAVGSSDGTGVLGVAFDFPALKSLNLVHGSGGYNYLHFVPADQPPGKIVFYLAGLEGDAAAVEEWQKQLPWRP